MISYIIVSYNTVKLTVQTIDSIVDKCRDYEIIIVDNDSHDGTVEVIKERYCENNSIQIIESGANIGFSAANNLGAKLAVGEYLVFVNPDTVFIEDVGNKLYSVYKNYFSKKDIILSPQIINPDYTEQHCMNLFPIITLKTPFAKIIKALNHKQIRKSDWITGVSLSMTKNTFEKLSGWNEKFDLYSEDMDICYRLKKIKGSAYVVKNTKLIHYGNQSGKQVYKSEYESERKKMNSLRKFYEIYYNENKFIKYLRIINLISKNENIDRYIEEEINSNNRNG